MSILREKRHDIAYDRVENLIKGDYLDNSELPSHPQTVTPQGGSSAAAREHYSTGSISSSKLTLVPRFTRARRGADNLAYNESTEDEQAQEEGPSGNYSNPSGKSWKTSVLRRPMDPKTFRRPFRYVRYAETPSRIRGPKDEARRSRPDRRIPE